MTTKTDNFATTENPLGSVNGKWTSALNGGLQCTASVGAKATTGSNQKVSLWNTADYTAGPDQEVEITYSGYTILDQPGFVLRCSGSGATLNGYAGWYNRNDQRIHLALITAGVVGADLKFFQWGAPVDGDRFKINVTATNFTIFTNGAQQNWQGGSPNFTDATYSSGQFGLYYDFGATNSTLITLVTLSDTLGDYFLNSSTPGIQARVLRNIAG